MALKRQLTLNSKNSALPPKPFPPKQTLMIPENIKISIDQDQQSGVQNQKSVSVNPLKEFGFKRQSTICVDKGLDKMKFNNLTLNKTNKSQASSFNTPRQPSETEQRIINVKNTASSFESAVLSDTNQSQKSKKVSYFSSSTDIKTDQKIEFPSFKSKQDGNKENKDWRRLLGEDDIEIMNEIMQKAYELSLNQGQESQTQALKEKEKLNNLIKKELEFNQNMCKQLEQENEKIQEIFDDPGSPHRKENKSKFVLSKREEQKLKKFNALYQEAEFLRTKKAHFRHESLETQHLMNVRDQPSINQKSRDMISQNSEMQEPLYLRYDKLIHTRETKLEKQRKEKKDKEEADFKNIEKKKIHKGSMSERQLQNMLQHHEMWEQSRNYKKFRIEEQVKTQRDRDLTFRPRINNKAFNSVNQSFEQRALQSELKKEKRQKCIKRQYDSNLTFKPKTNIRHPKVPSKPNQVCDMNLAINQDIYSIVNKYTHKGSN